MKITCQRDKMLSAFQMAASVAPTRSPKPILQNVKLEVSDSSAIFLATDLEIGIRSEVPVLEIESPGNVVLPVARFSMILRESADEKIRLESEPNGTLVRGERSEFRLPGENPAEFPPIAGFTENKYHEVSARLFRELIRRTVFATDTESSRYALGGVLLEMTGDRIVAVGTDGRRLAKMEGPAKSVGGHETPENSVIVPSKAMQLIERAISDHDGEVQIAVRANDILVKSQKTTIYSRLVEGRFPRWRDVFPTRDDAVKVEFLVGPLHAAVRQAAIVTSEESRGVDFNFQEGKLEISVRASQYGQSRVELPISYSGGNITIALDPRFVNDFLRVLDSDRTFTIELKDGEGAAVCSTDDGYDYVIMPLARNA